MSFVVILWSCAIGEPLCSHPDATWSGNEYNTQHNATLNYLYEIDGFERANPTLEVIKHEVMTRERWEFERGSYNCSETGGEKP